MIEEKVHAEEEAWMAMTTVNGAKSSSFTADSKSVDKFDKEWLKVKKVNNQSERLFRILKVDPCGKMSQPSAATYFGKKPLYKPTTFTITNSAQMGKAQLPLTLQWTTSSKAVQDGFHLYVVDQDKNKAKLAQMNGNTRSYIVTEESLSDEAVAILRGGEASDTLSFRLYAYDKTTGGLSTGIQTEAI